MKQDTVFKLFYRVGGSMTEFRLKSPVQMRRV